MSSQDVEDETRPHREVGKAVRAFRQWAGERSDELTARGVITGSSEVVHQLDNMASNAEMMLTYKVDYGSPADPYTWETSHIDLLLLDILPRKLVDDDPDDGENVTALRTFLEFLGDTGRFTEDSTALPDLLSRWQEAAAEYPARMKDPSNWGMAKSIMAPAIAQGIDLDDREALDAYVAAYNAGLPHASRPRREYMPTSIMALVDGLPLVERPAVGELLRQVRETDLSVLGPHASQQVIAACDADGETRPALAMQHWAEQTGMALIGREVDVAMPSSFAAAATFVILFAKGEIAVDDVHALLVSEFDADELGPWVSGVPIAETFEELEPLGLVTVRRERSITLTLTELGRYFAASVIDGEGGVAPLIGPMEEIGPATMIDLMDSLDDNQANPLFTRWSTEGGPIALYSTIAAAAVFPRDRRPPDFELAERFGQSALDSVATMMKDPRGTFYVEATDLIPGGLAVAREWLDEHGVAAPVPESDAERVWRVIDRLCPSMWDPPPDLSVFEELVPESWRAEFFGQVWRCDHLMATEALERLGKDHPAKKVRRAARQALHKLRARERR